MIEVEVKLLIKDLRQTREKLEGMGFALERGLQERDVYFDREDQTIRLGGMALRIRETTDLLSGGKLAQINFKGQKLDRITMTRQEMETTIGDAETGKEILRALGFVPVFPEVKKTRTMLVKDDMHACLDLVEGLGSFMELEILAEDERQREACLNRIGSVLEKLGVTVEDTIRTSYLTMLQKKKAPCEGAFGQEAIQPM